MSSTNTIFDDVPCSLCHGEIREQIAAAFTAFGFNTAELNKAKLLAGITSSYETVA